MVGNSEIMFWKFFRLSHKWFWSSGFYAAVQKHPWSILLLYSPWGMTEASGFPFFVSFFYIQVRFRDGSAFPASFLLTDADGVKGSVWLNIELDVYGLQVGLTWRVLIIISKVNKPLRTQLWLDRGSWTAVFNAVYNSCSIWGKMFILMGSVKALWQPESLHKLATSSCLPR